MHFESETPTWAGQGEWARARAARIVRLCRSTLSALAGQGTRTEPRLRTGAAWPRLKPRADPLEAPLGVMPNAGTVASATGGCPPCHVCPWPLAKTFVSLPAGRARARRPFVAMTAASVRSRPPPSCSSGWPSAADGARSLTRSASPSGGLAVRRRAAMLWIARGKRLAASAASASTTNGRQNVGEVTDGVALHPGEAELLRRGATCLLFRRVSRRRLAVCVLG